MKNLIRIQGVGAALVWLALAGQAGQLDQWTIHSTPPVRWRAVAYGRDRWVAVGDSGVVGMSTNGVNWTDSSVWGQVGTANRLGVAYGAGRFVAVGEWGDVITSFDGVSWRVASTPRPTLDPLRGIAYGNGRFAAVGGSGTVLTSAEGEYWSFQTNAPGAEFLAVSYGAGQFVAVGNWGAVYTSPDGFTWTIRSPPGSFEDLHSVVYGNGMFVAVGDFSGFGVSTNGSDWEFYSVNEAYSLLSITYGRGIFAAVGYLGTLVTSQDGRHWTPRASGTIEHLYAVAYGAGEFLAMGAAGVAIQSGELTGVTIQSGPATAGEPPEAIPGGFKFTRSGSTASNLTVNFTIAGTAENGIDYATVSNSVLIPAGQSFATLTISPLEDNQPEGNETVFLTLVSNEDYGVEWPGAATVTIGDAAVTLTASDPDASEPGADIGAFTLSRTGSTAQALTVDWVVSGTASPGTDYVALPASVTIPAGERSMSIPVSPADDPAIEDNETVRVTLLSGAGYVVRSPGAATVTLHDNELAVPDLDTWSWRNPAPATSGLYDVTFGTNLLVAVGGQGTILTSPDGIEWTTRPSATTYDLNRVAYGNEKFVAASSAGLVLSSPDGVTWTTQWLPMSIANVIYANSQFFVLGNNGQILTSLDGIGWTAQTNSTGCLWSGSWSDLAYGNGVFVAVSGCGNTLSSADGVTWTQHIANISTDLSGVTFGSGLFVAVSHGGLILSSPDGATWSQETNTPANLQAIRYGHGKFVAVNGSPAVIWTSTDGHTWTEHGSGGADNLSGVTASADGFVAVGGWPGSVVTSSDGENWTRRDRVLTTQDIQDISFGNGLFVALTLGDAVPVPGRPTTLTSPDGKTWTAGSTSWLRPMRAVTFGLDLFVAIGDGAAATSPDGVTWTEQLLLTPQSLYDVTYANGLFVAVGDRGTILTSPDGVTWAQQSSGSQEWLRAVSYGNGLFVAVGGYSPNVILTSPDGINWTWRESNTWQPLNAIAFGNGLFVAVGGYHNGCGGGGGQGGQRFFGGAGQPGGIPGGVRSYAKIITSQDGIVWTPQTPVLDGCAGLLGIGFGNDTFIAVGGACFTGWFFTSCSRTFLSSTDGVSWNARETGGGSQLLSKVTYGQATFVMAGENGTILQSGRKPPQPAFRSIRRLGDGSVRLTIQYPVNTNVTLEASADLLHWTSLATFPLPGVGEFTDTQARGQSKRFYRAKLVLP